MSTVVCHKRFLYSIRNVRTWKMCHVTFVDGVNLHIKYLYCFALALSVNFMYIGNYLHKYEFIYVKSNLY